MVVVAENLRPPGGGNSCLLGCCLVQSAQRYAHGLNQAAGVGPLSWPPRMSYQAALNTLHTRRDSRPLGSLKTAMWQSLLMTRLVVDPLLVTLRENCPQLDDLGHLQYCEVRCLTETYQVSSQILDFVPPSDPIRSNDCSLINGLISSSSKWEIKCN